MLCYGPHLTQLSHVWTWNSVYLPLMYSLEFLYYYFILFFALQRAHLTTMFYHFGNATCTSVNGVTCNAVYETLFISPLIYSLDCYILQYIFDITACSSDKYGIQCNATWCTCVTGATCNAVHGALLISPYLFLIKHLFLVSSLFRYSLLNWLLRYPM